MVVAIATPDERYFEKDVLKMSYGLMRRFVVGEDDMFRAGFIRFTKQDRIQEQRQLRPMWMDEFFVGLSGKGRIICRTQPDYDKEQVFEINPQDSIFMGRGTLRYFESISDEPWKIFYCAIPAASKGMGVKVLPSLDYDVARDKLALGHRANNLWSEEQ